MGGSSHSKGVTNNIYSIKKRPPAFLNDKFFFTGSTHYWLGVTHNGPPLCFCSHQPQQDVSCCVIMCEVLSRIAFQSGGDLVGVMNNSLNPSDAEYPPRQEIKYNSATARRISPNW